MTLNEIALRVHDANEKWWFDINTGEPLERNTGELLMLAVSELSEALEGDRKNLQDDKLPHRKMFDVEIVDCFIRLFDLSAARGIPLDEIFEEKMEYNSKRPDHRPENRKLPGGKKY
jgi:hypothetical protein